MWALKLGESPANFLIHQAIENTDQSLWPRHKGAAYGTVPQQPSRPRTRNPRIVDTMNEPPQYPGGSIARGTASAAHPVPSAPPHLLPTLYAAVAYGRRACGQVFLPRPPRGLRWARLPGGWAVIATGQPPPPAVQLYRSVVREQVRRRAPHTGYFPAWRDFSLPGGVCRARCAGAVARASRIHRRVRAPPAHRPFLPLGSVLTP